MKRIVHIDPATFSKNKFSCVPIVCRSISRAFMDGHPTSVHVTGRICPTFLETVLASQESI